MPRKFFSEGRRCNKMFVGGGDTEDASHAGADAGQAGQCYLEPLGKIHMD